MAEWVPIAETHHCPEGHAMEIVIQGRVIALFHVGGQFFALDGVCPHQGGPLGQGTLEGYVVTCPWHGWQFDVRTGRHQVNPNIQHTLIPLAIEGTSILARLPP